MNNFKPLIGKHIDFYLALALIAIVGTAVSLYFQFNTANSEFDTLNSSMYSVVQSRRRDLRDDIYINRELDDVDRALGSLDF